VRDRSAAANFRLAGAGTSRKTSVKGKATVTWTLTLKAGTYTYRSDTKASTRRTFVVTA